MAKQAILEIALVALSHTSTLRTITTTTTTDEENWGKQRCHEQIQRQQLRHCQMYLSQRMPYKLALGSPSHNSTSIMLPAVGNMDKQCRCDAARQMVRQPQEGGEMQGQEMREKLKKAHNLPSRCNFSPGQCQL